MPDDRSLLRLIIGATEMMDCAGTHQTSLGRTLPCPEPGASRDPQEKEKEKRQGMLLNIAYSQFLIPRADTPFRGELSQTRGYLLYGPSDMHRFFCYIRVICSGVLVN